MTKTATPHGTVYTHKTWSFITCPAFHFGGTLYHNYRPFIGFTRSGRSNTLRLGRLTFTVRLDAQ